MAFIWIRVVIKILFRFVRKAVQVFFRDDISIGDIYAISKLGKFFNFFHNIVNEFPYGNGIVSIWKQCRCILV